MSQLNRDTRQKSPYKTMISTQERNARKRAIDFARGSVRFEGIVLCPAIEEINRRFINGELTGDEHIAAIRAVVLNESSRTPAGTF
jgi:hypothetical protein